MKNNLLFILVVTTLFIACKKEESGPIPEPDYEIGKNVFTTLIDGDVREYLIHVPSIYDPTEATPVVFMLHGTTGFGERFYNISGWKEVGEVENILTVYPSSWQYCFIEDGVVKNTTRWNVIQNVYCPGETPKDDIVFLKQVVDELKQRFNVDSQRIYISGFSNGGAMAGRCAVEMSDIFAAVVEASGNLPKDTTFVPKRKLPVTFQLGNSDNLWLNSSSFSIPMSRFDTLLHNNPVFSGIVETHTTTFGFESTYTMTGDTNTYLTATFAADSPNPIREFNFVLIKGLEHNYPNGNNHPLKGAELHWDWMKQFKLQ